MGYNNFIIRSGWRVFESHKKDPAMGLFLFYNGRCVLIEMFHSFLTDMKTLKFRPELAQLILDDKKTTTWRLFDDKDLQTGDVVELVNKATLQPFGRATITEVVLKPIKDLDDADWEGHERFANEEAMYAAYREYYPGHEVGPDTPVKILHMTILK